MKASGQLIVGIVCGGLAGQIFRYVVDRPAPTVVRYSTTATSLSASGALKGAIPDLKIQIGDEPVPVLNTHSIEITAQKGPFLERARIAIEYRAPVRSYGKVITEKPSSLHEIDCKPDDAAILCTLGPLLPGQGSFRVVIVSDQEAAPRPTMAAAKVKLVPSEVFFATNGQVLGLPITGAGVAALIFVTLAGSVLATVYMTRRLGKATSLEREDPGNADAALPPGQGLSADVARQAIAEVLTPSDNSNGTRQAVASADRPSSPPKSEPREMIPYLES